MNHELARRWRENRLPALLYLSALAAAVVMACYAYRERVSPWTGALVWGCPTLLGALLGQLSALLRLRTWVLLALGSAWFTLGYYGGAYLVQASWFPGKEPHEVFVGGVGPTLFWYLVLWTPLHSLGGAFSLRRRWVVLACWFPVFFFTKATIPYIRLDSRWLSGEKWSVWTPGTLLVLLLTILFFLVFLILCERTEMKNWQRRSAASWFWGGRAASRWLRGSEIVLLLALLTLSTALYAPFLWNRLRDQSGTEAQPTASQGQNPASKASPQSDSKDPGGGSNPSPPDSRRSPGPAGTSAAGQIDPDPSSPQENEVSAGEGTEGHGRPQTPGSSLFDALGGAFRSVAEAALQSWWLLPLLLLLALLLTRPLRRFGAVRRWLDPDSVRTPTERIEGAWTALRTVLEDHGMSPRTAETASAFAYRLRREESRLGSLSDPILTCAVILDRVRYGLFIRPGDVEEVLRSARLAYRQLWRIQAFWQRIRSLYREDWE